MGEGIAFVVRGNPSGAFKLENGSIFVATMSIPGWWLISPEGVWTEIKRLPPGWDDAVELTKEAFDLIRPKSPNVS